MSSTNASPNQRRRQADRRAESENRLLSAAAELLIEKGISAATFGKIGDRAGLSRGLVTQRFGSKRGMIKVLINRLNDRHAARLADHHIENLSGIDGLLAYVDAFVDNLQADHEQRAYFVLLAASVSDKSDGTVRIFVCGRAVEHYAAMALIKRSPKMTANWALAMDHSRGGIFHSFSDRFKIR